jgi:hypothetical protein
MFVRRVGHSDVRHASAIFKIKTRREENFDMRVMAAAFVMMIAFSAMMGGRQQAFVPHPTASMPAPLIP